jgi:hypothetical protein
MKKNATHKAQSKKVSVPGKVIEFYEKGFRYAVSMKSRVFLDQMVEGLGLLDKGLTPDLEKNRDKLVAKLSIKNYLNPWRKP